MAGKEVRPTQPLPRGCVIGGIITVASLATGVTGLAVVGRNFLPEPPFQTTTTETYPTTTMPLDLPPEMDVRVEALVAPYLELFPEPYRQTPGFLNILIYSVPSNQDWAYGQSVSPEHLVTIGVNVPQEASPDPSHTETVIETMIYRGLLEALDEAHGQKITERMRRILDDDIVKYDFLPSWDREDLAQGLPGSGEEPWIDALVSARFAAEKLKTSIEAHVLPGIRSISAVTVLASIASLINVEKPLEHTIPDKIDEAQAKRLGFFQQTIADMVEFAE